MAPDTTPLQFKLIPPEAQRTAVQRLALRGLDIQEICARTGLSAGQVGQYLAGAYLTPDSQAYWLFSRRDSSGRPNSAPL